MDPAATANEAGMEDLNQKSTYGRRKWLMLTGHMHHPESSHDWPASHVALMTSICVARVTPVIGPLMEIAKARVDGNRAHVAAAIAELAIEVGGAILVPMAGTHVGTAFAIYATIVSTIALMRVLTEDSTWDPAIHAMPIARRVSALTGISLPERLESFNAAITRAATEKIAGMRAFFSGIHGRFLEDLHRRFPARATVMGR